MSAKTEARTDAAEDRRYCTFFVGGFLFGIEVRKVQEVLRPQRTTPVPRAPRVVSGLLNLRGQIVTAIDLRRRLLLPDRARDAAPMNVVLRTDDGPLSLLVDEIGDVIDTEDLEPPPETVPSSIRPYIHGVSKLRERLLLVLDAENAASAT